MTATERQQEEKMSTIKFKDGRVFCIRYTVVSLPVRFEKRGLRFRRAWVVK